MVRRTYNNMWKATQMIMAKGYDKETANKIAMQCFDNKEQSQNGMPVEWWINKIVDCAQYEEQKAANC